MFGEINLTDNFLRGNYIKFHMNVFGKHFGDHCKGGLGGHMGDHIGGLNGVLRSVFHR